MRRERAGESCRTRVFEAAISNEFGETCAGAGLERNPIAISVLISSFSTLP